MAKRFQIDTAGTLTTNLIAYLKEEDGTDFFGGNTVTDVASPTYTAGKVNNALTLNGSTQKQTLPASLISGYSGLSLVGWVKFTAVGSFQRIVSKTDDTLYNIMIRLTSGNKIAFHCTTLTETTITGATTISTGTWYWVAATYDGANMNLYVNSTTAEATSAKTGTLKVDTTNAASVGADGISAQEFVNGQIDEVGIWSKGLSATELIDLYNGGSGQTMIDSTTSSSNLLMMGV